MLATGPSPSPPESRAGDLAGPGARGAQPLSTSAAIGVASVTAAIVISAGVFVAERGEPQRVAAPEPMAPRPATTVQTTLPPVEPGLVESAAPSLPNTAPPVSTAATAAPSAPSGPIASAPVTLPAASLPPKLGYLLVRGTGEGRVYVNGVDVGPINEAQKALCGLRFVRVGTAKIGSRPPTWFGAGQSVKIRCRAVTEVDAKAAP